MKDNGKIIREVGKVIVYHKEVGVLVKSNNERYEGDWRDDKRNGKGGFS